MADGSSIQGVDPDKVQEVLARVLPILAELGDAANQGAALSDLVAMWLATLPPALVVQAMNGHVTTVMGLLPERSAELRYRQAEQRLAAN